MLVWIRSFHTVLVAEEDQTFAETEVLLVVQVEVAVVVLVVAGMVVVVVSAV